MYYNISCYFPQLHERVELSYEHTRECMTSFACLAITPLLKPKYRTVRRRPSRVAAISILNLGRRVAVRLAVRRGPSVRRPSVKRRTRPAVLLVWSYVVWCHWCVLTSSHERYSTCSVANLRCFNFH